MVVQIMKIHLEKTSFDAILWWIFYVWRDTMKPSPKIYIFYPPTALSHREKASFCLPTLPCDLEGAKPVSASTFFPAPETTG